MLGTYTPGALGSTVGPNGFIYAVTFDLANSAFFTINPADVTTHIINSSLGFPSDGLAVFDSGQFYTGAGSLVSEITGLAPDAYPFSLAFNNSSVPEPGTLVILATGLLGIALRRDRKITAKSHLD